MSQPDDTKYVIQSNGWKLGSCFRGSSSLASHLANVKEESICIAITQDCSVIHPSFESEPTVEVITASIIDKCLPEFENAKSQRTLHLSISDNGNPIAAELRISNRQFTDRKLLLNNTPDPGLALRNRERSILTRWLANRYSTVALPDAFEERISRVKKRLGNQFKSEESRSILGIYLALQPGLVELSDDEAYQVILLVIYEEDAFKKGTDESERKAYGKRLADSLNAAPGIEVLNVSALSERDVTVHTQRRMVLWNLDHYTFRGIADSDKGVSTD